MFFYYCAHLADWLCDDIHDDQALDHARSDGYLSIAVDFINTDKHRTVTRKPQPRQVTIGSTILAPQTNEIVLLVTDHSGQQWEVDALWLADQCVEAWRQYLAERDLDPPVATFPP